MLPEPGLCGTGFPFDVPAVAAIEQLRLDAPITLLAAGQRHGQVDDLEAVAEALGFAPEGGDSSGSARSARPADRCSATRWRRSSPARAARRLLPAPASFFNVAALVEPAGRSRRTEPVLRRAVHERRTRSRSSRWRRTASPASASRLDEPEAALSISASLALVAVMVRAAEAGARVVRRLPLTPSWPSYLPGSPARCRARPGRVAGAPAAARCGPPARRGFLEVGRCSTAAPRSAGPMRSETRPCEAAWPSSTAWRVSSIRVAPCSARSSSRASCPRTARAPDLRGGASRSRRRPRRAAARRRGSAPARAGDEARVAEARVSAVRPRVALELEQAEPRGRGGAAVRRCPIPLPG